MNRLSLSTPSRVNSQTISVLVSLMLLMLATRFFHVGSAWRLPDASWAVFFIGGFYLSRKYFLLLLIEAVAIDFAFFVMGGSQYCLSAAYAFQVPAFAVLWFGGESLRKIEARDAMFFVRGVAYWWVSASAAYLFTNASFYFLSGKASDPTIVNYFSHAQIWYAMFITRPMLYLILAAMTHFAIAQAQRWRLAMR